MGFDPEESARQTGHAQEIPPNVKPLSPQERKTFSAWADGAVKKRDQQKRQEITIRSAQTPFDYLQVLAQRVEVAQRFLQSTPQDQKAQIVFWGALTEMHLLVDHVEMLMLKELHPKGWRDPEQEKRTAATVARRRVHKDL